MASLASTSRGMGTARSVALVIGFAWSAALIVGAFFVPMYSSDGSGGAGSATLVGENGAHAVGVVAIPLVIVLGVAAALWRGHRTTAWTVTGLLIAFNLLAMLSIGVFVLPVTISLAVACSKSPDVGEPAQPV